MPAAYHFAYPPLDVTKKQSKTLDWASGYVALSYVWGPDRPSYEIEVNGQSFLVRSNLFEFLLQERKGRYAGSNHLWIDALCINQINLKECNHQVRQMLEIYKSAAFVLVWLGKRHDDVDKIFTFARDHKGKPAPEYFDQLSEKEKQTLFENLATVCKHDYWSRLWIVPEILAARDVHVSCGYWNVVSWSSLTSFVSEVWKQIRPPSGVSNETDLAYQEVIGSSDIIKFMKQRKPSAFPAPCPAVSATSIVPTIWIPLSELTTMSF
ncbi:hypothetical protein LTR70_008062 [Exophiala xenobiotica]|uniref:Heterokaryon incompatibility domain-containing protein n=1 Tax=Lithohypha guttulata TaxID=1690604 RepID=A0ABR0K3K8_9EURO|nr:hypothetical protein LTR24_007179 [Lithohypha guttulata]KAK5312619.1 hypothetical protein LTR70_008062 [Exophiala xenobiotica]